MILNDNDRATLQKRGISEEKFNSEIRDLKTGFPYLRIQAPATPGNGITVLSPEQRAHYSNLWDEYTRSGATIVKMVPASGAASRMFKDLFKFADSECTVAESDFITSFCSNIHNFAFFADLNNECIRLYGKDIDSLFQEDRHRDVVKALIYPDGMNYGQLPKALLQFHKYADANRTSLEEHLAEGAQYAAGKEGKVHVHFTLSPEHTEAVMNKASEAAAILGKQYGVEFDISSSIQKPSTDTVALGPDGQPFRTPDGQLFFRPGGHGALIENLGEIDADIIFIKNIDNVVPDSKRGLTVEYKKVLGGLLVETKRKIDQYIEMLSCGLPSRPTLNLILDFMRDTLCVTQDGAEHMEDLELADYLLCKLSRPTRVCGMVRNEGEPGGGPFLAYGPDGTLAPQILESSQIDLDKEQGRAMLQKATHFNPVDLVCSIKDDEGEIYDLSEFVDPDTGFISSKSIKGTDIKALELPGLWNGAMSDWNTIFVEVPAETFNPVKTVNDLLRPAHQA